MEKDIYAAPRDRRAAINWGEMHIRADRREPFDVVHRNPREFKPRRSILSIFGKSQ